MPDTLAAAREVGAGAGSGLAGVGTCLRKKLETLVRGILDVWLATGT